MFQIHNEPFGLFTKVVIYNRQTKEHVAIIPDFGANVQALSLGKHQILKGPATSTEMINNWPAGAKLVPFSNRVKHGKYTFRKQYQLDINRPKENHAIHGLIYDKPFTVKKQKASKTKAELVLAYTYKGSKGYPFPFRIQVTFTLQKNVFTYETEIVNLHNNPIPMSDGWHPYFFMEAATITAPTIERYNQDKHNIPSKKRKDTSFVKGKRVKAPLDACFHLGKGNVTLQNANYTVTFKLTNYPYLQLFIRDNAIAIEPMTCLPNCFHKHPMKTSMKTKVEISC